jgi:hypothetical protein
MRTCILTVLAILPLAHALQLFTRIKTAARVVIAASTLSLLPYQANAGLDALDGATRAMLSAKDKTVEQRKFESMPVGAQKRAALNAWYAG